MLWRGLPSSIDNMLDSVSGSVVNNIVLSLFTNGTAVLALVAIIKTLVSIVKTVGWGTFYASEPLIGILHGSRDNEGIKNSFVTALKTGLIYAAGLGIVLMLVKNPLLVFERGDDDFSKIGITMVQKMSSDILYSYAYHLNVITMGIET